MSMSLLELSRYLFLLGALPFIVLGLAHVALTPQTPADANGTVAQRSGRSRSDGA